MQKITLIVQEESHPLSPSDLADFLYLYRAVNIALDQVVPIEDKDEMREPTSPETERYRACLAELSPEQLDSFFDPKTHQDIVQIIQIERRSPLEIVLGGCTLLLTLGVIFSGGTISISSKSVKARLPPFGQGLKHLREALGLDKTIKAGYGIRATIKLSKVEFEALSKELTGQGGFQNMLRRLQGRVNKQTRELELTPDDLQRIHRYKANPSTGGFQSRFNKIFGRHFPGDSQEPRLNL